MGGRYAWRARGPPLVGGWSAQTSGSGTREQVGLGLQVLFAGLRGSGHFLPFLPFLLCTHSLTQAVLACAAPPAGRRLFGRLLAGVWGDAGVGVEDGEVGVLALLSSGTFRSLGRQVQRRGAETGLLQQDDVSGGLRVSLLRTPAQRNMFLTRLERERERMNKFILVRNIMPDSQPLSKLFIFISNLINESKKHFTF